MSAAAERAGGQLNPADVDDPAVRAAAAPHIARLEEVCEAALQHGEHGVLVDADGIREDPSVPYGTIHTVIDRTDDDGAAGEP